MRARVIVTLKREVLDPQGEAVRGALGSLGLGAIDGVRVGRVVDIELSKVDDPEEARRLISAAADRLLANPVIEDWRLEVLGETSGRG